MKVGMKIYSTNHDHVRALTFADFIEVLIVPGIDWKPLKDFDIAYKAHAPHDGFGLNLADPKKEAFNMKCVQESLSAAEGLGSPTLVLHPSGNLHEGSRQQALKMLEKISALDTDVKILLENLTSPLTEKKLCTMPPEFHPLFQMGFGFCMDFGHLAATAAHNNLDYKKVAREFVKLDPHYFHVSNGLTRSELDMHMPLAKGDFDLRFFRDVIAEEEPASVTLETPYNPEENFNEYQAFKDGVFV
jgi:deoxyribonuclease-4